MPPLKEGQPGGDRADLLPELHPERVVVQVDLPTYVENDKLLARQLNGLLPGQAEAVREVLIISFVMSFVSTIVLIGCTGVANRWTSLMETSGFSEWPQLGGIYVQMIVSGIPIVGLAVFTFVRLCCVRASRPWFVQALGKVCLAMGIVSIIGGVCLIRSWLTSKRLSDDMVRGLARQTGASANFNRAYCQAWCRQTATGLAAFVRGECGPDTPTVFTEIVSLLNVGDWCKEAIVKQNFDAGAMYSGISPLSCLNGRRNAALVLTPWSDMLAILNSLAGFLFFGMAEGLAEVRLHRAKSS